MSSPAAASYASIEPRDTPIDFIQEKFDDLCAERDMRKVVMEQARDQFAYAQAEFHRIQNIVEAYSAAMKEPVPLHPEYQS